MNSINQDWVSWLDSSGNLVMAEKQRTSGSGAQGEINDASASGAQDESDEDDFVTITGVTRVDDPIASIDLCLEAVVVAVMAEGENAKSKEEEDCDAMSIEEEDCEEEEIENEEEDCEAMSEEEDCEEMSVPEWQQPITDFFELVPSSGRGAPQQLQGVMASPLTVVLAGMEIQKVVFDMADPCCLRLIPVNSILENPIVPQMGGRAGPCGPCTASAARQLLRQEGTCGPLSLL